MGSLTLDDFKIGKDSRKGASVADADRLIQLTNAFINKGKIPQKRQGSLLDVTLETGTAGLASANGVLNTFYGIGTITHADPNYLAHLVNGTVEQTVFSGTGPDDLNSHGAYSGLTDALYEFEIDVVDLFTITAFADSLTNPGVATTVTSTGHTIVNGRRFGISGTTSYNGDQFASDVTANTFDIQIPFVADDATGTAEASTYRWRKDGGAWSSSSWVVAGFPIQFEVPDLGLNIEFDSQGAGRQVGDLWSFNAKFYNSVQTIHFADSFLGFLYVVVEYDTGYIRHHYLDGSDNTTIKDTNCPHTVAVLKMEEKIWAVDGDVVRFSATGKPKDWTTSLDSGFLPTGLKTRNADNAIALGQYRNHQLVVLFEDGAQLWNVDPDPALHSYEKSLDGFQTRFPRSVLKFAGDLFVLSDGGVRSTTEKVFSENINEEDVGSPIDKDIKAVLTDTSTVFSGRYNSLGQYWVIIDSNVFVYTFSSTGKISAWSIYTYGFTIDALEEFKGRLYMRSGNSVYLVDESVFRDDGVAYEAVIQTAFLNAKSPGVDKIWDGLHTICEGTADVSFRWDPNNDDFETSAIQLTGDTTGGGRAPVEINSPSLSFIFKNQLDEAFEVQSFTAYFTELGVQ